MAMSSNIFSLNFAQENPEKLSSIFATVDLINDHLKDFNLCLYCKMFQPLKSDHKTMFNCSPRVKLQEALLPLIKSTLYISALILTLDLEGPLRGCLSSNCEPDTAAAMANL